jgi:hypothetical protein
MIAADNAALPNFFIAYIFQHYDAVENAVAGIFVRML